MINNTNLWYRGEVNMRLRIKDRTFDFKSHNEGLPALSESFARIMSGNYRGLCDIPRYIDVRKLRPGTDDEYLSYLTVNKLPLTGANWAINELGEYEADFTATIASTMLYSLVPVNSSDKFKLYLCTDTEDGKGIRDLARLDIPALQLSRIVPGVQAVIEWSMKLVNPTEEE